MTILAFVGLVVVGVVLLVGELDDAIVGEQDLDALLDRSQQLLALTDQLHAFFEARERLLERQLASLELPHDLVEAAEQRLGGLLTGRLVSARRRGLGLTRASHRRAVYRRPPAPSTIRRQGCAEIGRAHV